MARILVGRVINDATDKTIVVRVQSRRTHRLYQKQYSVTTKFLAHDQENKAKRGDLVSIIESRPLSARKHFRLAKIIEQAGVQFEERDATADLPQEEQKATRSTGSTGSPQTSSGQASNEQATEKELSGEGTKK